MACAWPVWLAADQASNPTVGVSASRFARFAKRGSKVAKPEARELRAMCARWTGRSWAGVDLCPPPDSLSKREVVVDRQRRVVAEALI